MCCSASGCYCGNQQGGKPKGGGGSPWPQLPPRAQCQPRQKTGWANSPSKASSVGAKTVACSDLSPRAGARPAACAEGEGAEGPERNDASAEKGTHASRQARTQASMQARSATRAGRQAGKGGKVPSTHLSLPTAGQPPPAYPAPCPSPMQPPPTSAAASRAEKLPAFLATSATLRHSAGTATGVWAAATSAAKPAAVATAGWSSITSRTAETCGKIGAGEQRGAVRGSRGRASGHEAKPSGQALPLSARMLLYPASRAGGRGHYFDYRE